MLAARDLYLHGDDVCGIESRIDGEYPLQAAQQQPGADEEHQREGDFSHDEYAADEPMPAGSAELPSPQPIADDCNIGPLTTSFGLLEVTTHRRCDAQRAEIFGAG